LLGETLDRRRVERIAGVARGLGKVRIVGRGSYAVLAAYAALYEPDIVEVIAVEPTPTHRDGPHFLGVLRALDVPTALALLAAATVDTHRSQGQGFRAYSRAVQGCRARPIS
jgi:hypothetical protein